jgi:hypothetical protein
MFITIKKKSALVVILIHISHLKAFQYIYKYYCVSEAAKVQILRSLKTATDF